MKNSPDKMLYRILDANFNRAKEGLRVCEDLCRYVWNQKTLTRTFKDVRHGLTQIIAVLDIQKVLQARHIQGDVGRATTISESKRDDINAVFWANSQRVKESLRVLEEVTKLMDAKISSKLKVLRYKVYALEQKVIRLS
ncbi:MAG: thiamine-phosphate pyrophosphorylase [Candidatus Omnitrophica bacterium]|nr:thiamine-phosphate pyrophosphorylase [Candidatus Omnitrophota bacterium]